ncbi:MAG: efflux RND transporter periplasmic adaptor subunit [bacterium]|nr:efflux RND transporter periplasmic adaptor subunit [bacterium]
MKIFKKKRTYIIILVIVIFLILLFGKRKGAVSVEVKQIKLDSIEETVNSSGALEPFVDVEISSDIMGKCLRIYVKEGDSVKKGTPLLKIDDISQQARLKEAETALNYAQSNFDYVSYKFENQKKLFEQDLISKSEFTLSELEYKNSLNLLTSAKSSYEIAKDNLEKTVIKSPIDGIVTAIYVEEGENIITGTMNNAGTVLMTISNNKKLIVKANVDETSISKVKNGNIAKVVFDAFPEKTFTGKVYVKANRPKYSTSSSLSSSSTTSVEYEVKIILDDSFENKLLVSGMSCDVDIVTLKKDSVLSIPIQSIVNRENREGVFKYSEGKIHFVPVKTGITGNLKTEIFSDSLKEGDSIVTGPFLSFKNLKDGLKVKISTEKKSPYGRKR